MKLLIYLLVFALVAFTFAEDEDSPAHWYDKQDDDMLHLLSTFFTITSKKIWGLKLLMLSTQTVFFKFRGIICLLYA